MVQHSKAAARSLPATHIDRTFVAHAMLNAVLNVSMEVPRPNRTPVQHSALLPALDLISSPQEITSDVESQITPPSSPFPDPTSQMQHDSFPASNEMSMKQDSQPIFIEARATASSSFKEDIVSGEDGQEECHPSMLQQTGFQKEPEMCSPLLDLACTVTPSTIHEHARDVEICMSQPLSYNDILHQKDQSNSIGRFSPNSHTHHEPIEEMNDTLQRNHAAVPEHQITTPWVVKANRSLQYDRPTPGKMGSSFVRRTVALFETIDAGTSTSIVDSTRGDGADSSINAKISQPKQGFWSLYDTRKVPEQIISFQY